MQDEPPLSDLLAAVAQGQQPALRAIYLREGTRLFGIAMAILRDRPAAADAVQDAFLRVWKRAGQFDPAKGDGGGWLSTIVRHAALDAVRARGREVPTDDPGLGDTLVEPTVLDDLAAGQDAARLHACLAGLEEKNARMIVLAFVHGLSHAQIADRVAMPLGTVKSWIRRGLLSLRECLS